MCDTVAKHTTVREAPCTTSVRTRTRRSGVNIEHSARTSTQAPWSARAPALGCSSAIDWFRNDGATGFGPNVADFVEDAGFTKLREIAVQYTWDGAFVTRTLGLTSVDLRIAGRNLATWTGYRGLDPETNLNGAELIQGVDWFNNPQSRSLIVSIGLNH